MKIRLAVRAFVSLFAVACSSPGLAADLFSIESFGGLEYDSRVTVEELDLQQSDGDTAALLEAEFRVRPIESRKGSLTIGYDLSQRSYFDLQDFNRQSHRLHADGELKVGIVEIGAEAEFAHYRLGGDALLNIHSVEPNFSVPISARTRVQGSYRYANRDFHESNARDGDLHLASLNVSHRLARRTRLTVGARYEREDVLEPRFDFDGFQLNSTLQMPFRLTDRRGYFRVGYNYRERHYDNITPSIGERRRENRSTLSATAEAPFSDRIALRSSLRYTDRNSNFLAADYKEVRASTGIVVRL